MEMTLRECKKLQVNDEFRRPSTNPHDNAWREYQVISIEIDNYELAAFTVEDQHRYRARVRLTNWQRGDDKAFMRSAELITDRAVSSVAVSASEA